MKLRKIKGTSTPSLGVGSNAMHAFVPGGPWVFRASGRDTQLWTFDGEKKELGGSQREDPSSVAVSADGKLGAIGFRRGFVRVVDLDKGKTVKQFAVGKGVVEDIFFAGDTVVSCADSLQWSSVEGKKLKELKCKPFRAAASSAGAVAAVTWSKGIVLEGKTIHPGSGLDIAMSADGSRIVALQHADEGYDLRVFDGAGKQLAEWSAMAERVLAVTPECVVVTRVDDMTSWLDAYSLKGKALQKLKAPDDALDSVPAFDGVATLALGKRYALEL